MLSCCGLFSIYGRSPNAASCFYVFMTPGLYGRRGLRGRRSKPRYGHSMVRISSYYLPVLTTASSASAQHHVSSSARRTLHRAFSRWRGQLSQHQTLALRADLVREGKLTSSTLLTWVAASRRLQMNVVTAEKARAFFLQRLVVRSWRDRLAGRHQSALVERRRLKDLGAAFSRESCNISRSAAKMRAGWRERTAQHRLERRMIDEFQQTQEKVCFAVLGTSLN